jgi:hypothetical protein
MGFEANHQVRRQPRALSALAASTLIVLLGAPVAAQAKIIVDPEGPAGKQYSAVLDRAREEASGGNGTAGVPGSTAKAPPFGEGIESAQAGRAEGGAGAGGPPVAPPDSLGAIDEGGAALRLAGISLAVLALGALLAFAARWGARRLSG